MARVDKYPGWSFPTEGSTDWNDAIQAVQRAAPCPHCGALVPVEYVQFHVDFHNAVWRPGFAPRSPLPVYVPTTAPDPSIQSAKAGTDPSIS